MKKILAVAALILIIVSPLMAADAMGETYVKDLLVGLGSGAATGAGIGFGLGGPAGAFFGALFGAVTGVITGGITGSVEQNEKDEEAIATKQELLDNKIVYQDELDSRIKDQEKTLARWQDEYDTMRQKDTLQATSELEALKENWGIYNSTLASQNRGGITARALAGKQKDLLTVNFGDDMSLDTDFDARLDDLLSNKDYYDEEGHLTEIGEKAYNDITSGYGLYEKTIMDKALESRLNHESGKSTFANNKDAYDRTTNSIATLQSDIAKLKKRRWGDEGGNA